jgi:hypothetical protein
MYVLLMAAAKILVVKAHLPYMCLLVATSFIEGFFAN